MAEALPATPVASVELYVDGALLARIDRAPYRRGWQLQPGVHEFRARAVMPDGNEVWSNAATVTVLPP
jgi:hypothetical protein